MKKRDSGAVLLIFAALIAVTLFVSPVNRSPLDKESGSSGIEVWEYLPSEYRLSEETSMGFESIRSSNAWTSLDSLEENSTVGAEVFWLRGRLPEKFSIYSPTLFLEFDFPVEVYVDGSLIYSFGKLADRDRVLPFPHMVPISDGHKGKMVYFKYPAKEGLTVKELRHLTAWDTVVGSEKAKELSNHEIAPMIMSIIGVFIGVCFILIAILIGRRQREEAQLIAFAGLFDSLISISILNYLYVVRAYLNQPVLVFYTDYISYILIPYAAGSFLVRLLKSRAKAQMNIINSVFPLYLAFVILMSRIPGFDISRADYAYGTCLLAYSVYMVYLLVKELGDGQKDLRIMTVGLVIAGATGVIDVLQQLNVFDFPGVVSCYGIFILTICVVCYFGLRFFHLYDDVKAANIQLTKSKEIIEEINRDLDRKVIEKTSAIRSLFDNAEQGFLSFKEDLTVGDEYSFKCSEIFGGDISGQRLPKLIGGGSREQEHFVGTLLQKVFSLQDEGRREVYLSLLPTELNINEKLVNIAYKLIVRGTEASELICMVILTDVTEKHLLEMKLAQEQSIFKMSVKVVANHNDFVNAVRDYKNFCSNRVNEIINSDMDIENKYAELFREIHTFKGTFAQFEMQHITKRLHDFETIIDHYRRVRHGIKDLEGLFVTNKPEEWLERDYDILRGVLGERYLKFDKLVVIEESRLKEIEAGILASFSGSEGLALVKEIRKLRYRFLKDMLGHYPEYCMRLSERLKKPINNFKIQGSDIAVDSEIYSGLSKAMVHVFRNMVDHGIETAEERTRCGKPELGNISCSIKVDGGNIEITVCDDGAGIDIENIRRIAEEKQLMTLETAAAASEAEMLQMLFANGFTTAENVSELSGRGIGLPAVKAEVELLSGSIKVETKKGQGTSFCITVPVIS
ncbi:MAG TPA: ATP-binding protein [Clostridia bacterium]|nr:ATP-binding protein [Clostridia bacterium]